MRIRPWSDLLANVCSLVGIPTSRLTTEINDTINSLANGNLRNVWDICNWTDICPKGEARFCGNLLTYPNDLSKTANWTATNLTITGDSIANPADNRTTASKLAETVTNGAHKAVQSLGSMFPGQLYQVSAYARPFGTTNWLYLSISDGSATFTSFFNVYTGVLGTASTNIGSAAIQPCANGFFLCTVTFYASTSATTGTATVQTSSDGSTLSYAGTITNGLYVWGVLALQQTAISPQIYTIPWSQTGENEIETVFQAWKDNPNNASYPRSQGWLINPDGIQMISSLGWDTGTYGYTGSQGNPANPTYLYYRKAYKYFTGSVYSSATTYVVGAQIYYTITTAGSAYGTSDYYACLVNTTAAQSPETTPASWEKIKLPEIFYSYLVWQTYGDWLQQDGQADKASGAYAMALMKKDDELDRQERQQYDIMPMQVSTHVSSQPRY